MIKLDPRGRQFLSHTPLEERLTFNEDIRRSGNMDKAISRFESVNSAHIIRKRIADPGPSSTKRRRFDSPDDLETPTLKLMNAALFQSSDPTEGRENGEVISENCDIMEDVQDDPLVDLFAQVAVGKEYDHIVWNGDEVYCGYSALALNNDRNGEELSWDIGCVWRLLPLFVIIVRSSAEMLTEILRLKAHQYDPSSIYSLI